MTDPISDMLARIRNAIAVRQSSVELPYSKIKEELARALVASGFLTSVKTDSSGQFKKLQLEINEIDRPSSISQIKRLSRPGQRHYTKSGGIPKVRRGRGIVIISTSQGIMTGEDAKAKKLGGELICEVY